MAAHHSYWDQPCPSCGIVRTIRKDRSVTCCRSCASKARIEARQSEGFAIGRGPKYGLGVKKDPVYKGSYSSYTKAKRRCKTNYKGAYANIEFRFESFDQWFAELGIRPEGMTVDRIDNNGHYEPGNVRWATHEQQCANRGPWGRHTKVS
jgi:hypothetical protein